MLRSVLVLALVAGFSSHALAMSQMDLPAGYPPSSSYIDGAMVGLAASAFILIAGGWFRAPNVVRSLPWVVGCMLLMTTACLAASDGTEPDPVLTPGAVRTTSRAEICGTKTSTVRHVTGSEKLAVFRRYGMSGPSATFPGTDIQGPWEIDHVISLELGGSNDITNLWPESYNQPMGAHQKDALENRLHHLVCAGRLSVEEAQRAIATDWIAAYRLYVGEAE